MTNKSSEGKEDVRLNGKSSLITYERLHEDYSRLQLMLGQIPCIIWATDSELRLTASMGTLATAMGLSDDQIVGMTLGQYFRTSQPDFRTIAAHAAHLRALKGKSGSYELEWLGRIVMCHVEPLRDRGGKIEGVIGVGSDVTELKQTHRALRQTERKLDLTFASVAEGILVTDLYGTIIEANSKVLEMHGYQDRTEIVGKDAFILIAPSDRERAINNLQETLKGGVVRDVEYNFIRKRGSMFPASLTASVLKDTSGKPIGFIAVTRDITERKQAEQEIIRYQDRLREVGFKLSLAEESERRRIAQAVHNHVGHGLTILNIKLGELIESMSPDFSTELRQMRQHVNKLAQEARSLAFDLSSPILYELGLMEALDYLAEDYSKKYNIRCIFESDQKEYTISKDVAIFIYQAVRELLTNVLKHAKAQTARISLSRSMNQIVVKVQDDGCGISCSLSELHAIKSLGLFSIRERLKYIGGHLSIDSRSGHGTKVVLEIPLVDSSQTTDAT